MIERVSGGALQSVACANARRLESRRLIALALETLDEEHEQIVRDYLNHALCALEYLCDSPIRSG